MRENQNEFTSATKELLAKRVCYRCSNPRCRKTTSGPGAYENDVTKIGEAAHICSAAPGGKRYDPEMTPDQRRAPSNGIWLCCNCHKLIDSNPQKYTVELLYYWKQSAEAQTEQELSCQTAVENICQDIDRIKFYLQCIDRPAFQDCSTVHYLMKPLDFDEDIVPEKQDADEIRRRTDAFENAIHATIVAINTGVLRDGEGNVIMQSEGKSLMENPVWRDRLIMMTDILVEMRNKLIRRKEDILQRNVGSKYIMELEYSRRDVVWLMNSICRDVGLPQLRIGGLDEPWYGGH